MKKLHYINLLFVSFAIVILALCANASAKSNDLQVSIGTGLFLPGKMNSVWPKGYDKWSLNKSQLHAINVGYGIHKNVVLGANIQAGFLDASNLARLNMPKSRDIAWMMLSAGLFADYKIHVGNGAIYIGLDCSKTLSYDNPKQPTKYNVMKDGWIYGGRIGVDVPVFKSMSIYAQSGYVMSTSKANWYSKMGEFKWHSVPIMGGIRFKL